MNLYRSSRVFVAAVLTLVATAGSASAQTASSTAAADRQWADLAARLAGSQVDVERYDRSRVKGMFDISTADLISVTSLRGPERIARADVSRVRVPSRAKRILYGSIGVAAGALGGFFACPYCSNEYGGHPTEYATLIGGALGSLVFLVPRTTTVYRGPGK